MQKKCLTHLAALHPGRLREYATHMLVKAAIPGCQKVWIVVPCEIGIQRTGVTVLVSLHFLMNGSW